MEQSLSNILNKINTALRNKKSSVEIITNKKALQLLVLLVQEGLLRLETGGRKTTLWFTENKLEGPLLKKVRLLAKPGRKVPVQWKSIRNYRQGTSFTVLSTSKGLLRDQEAIRCRVGGILLVEVIL